MCAVWHDSVTNPDIITYINCDSDRDSNAMHWEM